MNRIRIVLVGVLVLGISSLLSAQEPAHEPKAPEQEAPRNPAPRPEEPKPQKQEKPDMQKPEKPDMEKPDKQAEKQAEKQQKEQKEEPKSNHEERTAQTQSGHAAAPSGKGARIPEERFRSNFGRQHSFAVNRVVTQRTIVAGQTQFVYSGYTFVFVDPWPAEWAYTDDCYIDYMNDEYVLVDPLHPGIFIALMVIE